MTYTGTEARFWSKVDTDGSTVHPDLGKCWLWRASRDRSGYGRFKAATGVVGAHRVAYELLVGPIPDGLTLDHLCRVRHCVNPEHLEPVTHRENTLRGTGPTAENARKTHCLRGHALTHGRRCMTCARNRSKAYLRKPEARAKRAARQRRYLERKAAAHV